nr:hypothetical protein [Tanacetum cinerariifolium]
MDLLSFIRTAGPTKVRAAERQRVENEPRLLESTIGRVVPLLPIEPAHASSELEASVDVALLQPRRQRKRKIVVADASGPSHPPKKLREDYGALGGASTADKSRSAVQSLFTGAVLNAEAKGESIPTLPFVTSSISATPEREDKSLVDSVTGLNLRTIGARRRFVISSDSSHHSGANIAEAEVDSIVRSSVPAIATVTTVTVAVDADTTADRVPVLSSLFGVGSSSTGRTDSVPGGFFDVSGSDFLIGGIRTVVDPGSDLQKVYISKWSATNGFGLDDSLIYREMFSPSLMLELRSNKDASVDTITNLLRLDDALAKRLGLTESQPHANQLMVPIHHSPDQRVVGASTLSLSLDVSHSRVRKIRQNIASHVSALRGVFVPLYEPLSAADLEGTEGGAGVDDETAAVGNIDLFSDVSNAELNILE